MGILDDFYQSQPPTYGLLPPTDRYLQSLAASVCARADPQGIIVEIGCNDGMLLSEIKSRHSRDVLGIEPSQRFHRIWAQRNLEVINDFFSDRLIPEFADKSVAVIIIRHVLEHIPDPISFLSAVAKIMRDSTLLVIESPYLPTVIEHGRFENISYAHLNHFTSRAIHQICSPLGVGIESIEFVNTDGGSFVALARRGVSTRSDVLDHVKQDHIVKFLQRMRTNGLRLKNELAQFGPDQVVGYGAGAKGPFLLSLYEIGGMLQYVVDDNPSFHGLYLAGTGNKVVGPEIIQDESIRAVLILAPTHEARIKASLPRDKTVISIV